jgi:hypothetical protein
MREAFPNCQCLQIDGWLGFAAVSICRQMGDLGLQTQEWDKMQGDDGLSLASGESPVFTSCNQLPSTPLRAWVRGWWLTTTSFGVSPDLASPAGGYESRPPAAMAASDQKVGIHVAVRRPKEILRWQPKHESMTTAPSCCSLS